MEQSTDDAQTIAELGKLLKRINEHWESEISTEMGRLKERICSLQVENADSAKESTKRIHAHNALVHHVNITENQCAELKAKIRKLKKKRR